MSIWKYSRILNDDMMRYEDPRIEYRHNRTSGPEEERYQKPSEEKEKE